MSNGITERERRPLEKRLLEQQETIESMQETLRRQQETIDSLRAELDGPGTVDTGGVTRRGALQAGGVLGLLGLGAGVAGATPSGQIGTADRPLETLHTAELDGPLAGEHGPITDASTDPASGALALRDSDGALAVADATDDDHAVARGQDVTWSGDHGFESMPQVGDSEIVESGSNDNGIYVRLASGVQLISKYLTVDGLSESGTWGESAWSEVVDLGAPAKPFAEPPNRTTDVMIQSGVAWSSGGGNPDFPSGNDLGSIYVNARSGDFPVDLQVAVLGIGIWE